MNATHADCIDCNQPAAQHNEATDDHEWRCVCGHTWRGHGDGDGKPTAAELDYDAMLRGSVNQTTVDELQEEEVELMRKYTKKDLAAMLARLTNLGWTQGMIAYHAFWDAHRRLPDEGMRIVPKVPEGHDPLCKCNLP